MFQYQLADFISRIHVAACHGIISVKVSHNLLNLRLLTLFSVEGFIEGYRVFNDFILVFLKKTYLNEFLLFKNVTICSTPGRRQYWNLVKLSKKYSYKNFSGIYIISSNKGFITNFDALLKYRSVGEVVLKISV